MVLVRHVKESVFILWINVNFEGFVDGNSISQSAFHRIPVLSILFKKKVVSQ